LNVKFDDTLFIASADATDLGLLDSSLAKNTSGLKIKTIKPLNLLTIARIIPHDAVFGGLLFIFPEAIENPNIKRGFHDIKSYRIGCRDIMGKMRFCKLNDLQSQHNFPYFSPRTGTLIDSLH